MEKKLYMNFKNNIKLVKEKINYMDIAQDSNENNDFINNHLKESSINQIEKRNNFYGDLTYLNESTYETQVNLLQNLNENNELGNV